MFTLALAISGCECRTFYICINRSFVFVFFKFLQHSSNSVEVSFLLNGRAPVSNPHIFV